VGWFVWFGIVILLFWGTFAAIRASAIAVRGQEPVMPAAVIFVSHHLHCMSHSAVVAAVVTLLVWWLRAMAAPGGTVVRRHRAASASRAKPTSGGSRMLAWTDRQRPGNGRSASNPRMVTKWNRSL
jgi:hypothetical protein